MTKSIIAKYTVGAILGLTCAHFWSIGEQRLAVFILATIIFNTFFVVAEEKKTVPSDTFASDFAREMRKWKNNKLF